MPDSTTRWDVPSQLSLVAFYRDTPSPLARLIGECRMICEDHIGDHFNPYAPDQVHATITGMERVPLVGIDDVFLNRNAHVLYDRRIEMRFDTLKETVRSHLPFTIRWGGYEPGDVAYVGKSSVPFTRSIYFNRSTGKLVLIGWPHQSGDFSVPRLLNLRNALENECGLVHKYRNDNDLFQVLGKIDLRALKAIEENLDRAERRLSELLNDTRLNLELAIDNCLVVGYKSTDLPPDSTKSFSLGTDELSTALLKSLYGSDGTTNPH